MEDQQKQVDLLSKAWAKYIIISNESEGTFKKLSKGVRDIIAEILTTITDEKIFISFADRVKNINALNYAELRGLSEEGIRLQEQLEPRFNKSLKRMVAEIFKILFANIAAVHRISQGRSQDYVFKIIQS